MSRAKAALGELIFVGLGLGEAGVSLAGRDVMAESDVNYLETYTSPPPPNLAGHLERAIGKRVSVVGREFVEDGKKILEQAANSRVVIAVQGDPMIATTHSELRARAMTKGIKTRVIHAATIGAAAASESGLHYYKFGRTITFTRESASNHLDVYRTVHKNLLEGGHTLLLLEYDVEKEEGAEPNSVFEGLLEAEKNYRRGVVSEETFAVVLCRIGMKDQAIRGGEIGNLRTVSFGRPPYCVVIPGRLHFTEVEAMAAFLGLDADDIVENSSKVRRTAQVLVPRYVEKARRAIEEAKEGLKGAHGDLIENAELYLKDSEGFLANEEDELAMLSVGYAEGLVDALSFIGEVKLSW